MWLCVRSLYCSIGKFQITEASAMFIVLLQGPETFDVPLEGV